MKLGWHGNKGGFDIYSQDKAVASVQRESRRWSIEILNERLESVILQSILVVYMDYMNQT